jgi:hypothetical protein
MKHNEYFQQSYSNDHTQGIGYFQNKFECRIEPSREYKQYVRQVPQYHHDIRSMESYHIQTEVVPMQSIHLSSDNLNKLIAEQELIRHMRNDAEQGKQLWRQMMEDRTVRESNPAVEKAWRNYQMLLELARQ